MEHATWQARQDAARQVAADLAADLHSQEIMTGHQGAPSIAVQNATHGAPAPEPDLGKPLPRTWP